MSRMRPCVGAFVLAAGLALWLPPARAVPIPGHQAVCLPSAPTPSLRRWHGLAAELADPPPATVPLPARGARTSGRLLPMVPVGSDLPSGGLDAWLAADPLGVYVDIGEPAVPFATLIRIEAITARVGASRLLGVRPTHGVLGLAWGCDTQGSSAPSADQDTRTDDEAATMALSLAGSHQSNPARPPVSPTPAQLAGGCDAERPVPSLPECAVPVRPPTVPVGLSAAIWLALEGLLLAGVGVWRRMTSNHGQLADAATV